MSSRPNARRKSKCSVSEYGRGSSSAMVRYSEKSSTSSTPTSCTVRAALRRRSRKVFTRIDWSHFGPATRSWSEPKERYAFNRHSCTRSSASSPPSRRAREYSRGRLCRARTSNASRSAASTCRTLPVPTFPSPLKDERGTELIASAGKRNAPAECAVLIGREDGERPSAARRRSGGDDDDPQRRRRGPSGADDRRDQGRRGGGVVHVQDDDDVGGWGDQQGGDLVVPPRGERGGARRPPRADRRRIRRAARPRPRPERRGAGAGGAGILLLGGLRLQRGGHGLRARGAVVRDRGGPGPAQLRGHRRGAQAGVLGHPGPREGEGAQRDARAARGALPVRAGHLARARHHRQPGLGGDLARGPLIRATRAAKDRGAARPQAGRPGSHGAGGTSGGRGSREPFADSNGAPTPSAP